MCLTLRSLIVFLMLAGSISFGGLLQAEEGLEVYYDFETESATDQSGNGRDGEVVGAVDLIDGVVGKAWQFDGATVINMTFPMMTEADLELSIRCFILPDEVDMQHIIYDEGGGWTGFTVRIMDGNLEFATVCCTEAHPPPVIVSAKYPDTDDWTEIAAVFGKGQMFLYINGEEVGTEKTDDWQELGGHGQTGGIGEMSPGDTAFGGGGGFFMGGMDEFRIYSRMLQPEELDLSVSSRDKLAATWGALKSG